jgi:hypothetical protein
MKADALVNTAHSHADMLGPRHKPTVKFATTPLPCPQAGKRRWMRMIGRGKSEVNLSNE